MNLFYHPDIQHTGTFEFGQEESRHISKALRHNTGDEIYITDGKGRIYRCFLNDVSSKACVFEVIDYKDTPAKTFRIHLAVAPTKMNDRYEWLVEKSTELGIDELSPVICEHSERKALNAERLEKIAISAMKQSLSSRLPKINPCITFREFLQNHTENARFIAHCRNSEEKLLLKNILPKDASVVVFIGPEGDFSISEIETAINSGYIPVSLGSSRLRTETAALVACHTVTLIHET